MPRTRSGAAVLRDKASRRGARARPGNDSSRWRRLMTVMRRIMPQTRLPPLYCGRDHSRRGRDRRFEMGPRHAGAVPRSRRLRAQPRHHADATRRDGRGQPPPRQVAPLPGHRAAPARRRIDRHLHRESQRGGGVLRPRHRPDPDDDLQRHRRTRSGARWRSARRRSAVHPGGRSAAERARSERCRRRPPASSPTSSSTSRSARAAAFRPASRRWRSASSSTRCRT